MPIYHKRQLNIFFTISYRFSWIFKSENMTVPRAWRAVSSLGMKILNLG